MDASVSSSRREVAALELSEELVGVYARFGGCELQDELALPMCRVLAYTAWEQMDYYTLYIRNNYNYHYGLWTKKRGNGQDGWTVML